MRLNEAQTLLAETHEGPIIVHARPGTGKTTAVVHNLLNKFAHERIDPRRVLVTTFSKEAAKTILTRVRAFLGTAAPNASIGTTHSIFFKILSGYGVFPTGQFIREWQARSFIYDIVPRKFIAPGEENNYLALIGLMKSNLCWYEEGRNAVAYQNWLLAEAALKDRQIDARLFKAIWKNYETKKTENGLKDFDDILFDAYCLLNAKPDYLRSLQNFFDYVVVDEFQDSNVVQYELFRLLAGRTQNLLVVGDENQAIYGFRGSKPEFMGRFKTDYPQASIIEFRETYRSTPEIAATANQFIATTPQISNGIILTSKESGSRPLAVHCETLAQESEFIAHSIAQSPNEFDQIAILTRYNAQQPYLEQALMRANIPYQIAGNDLFYNRPDIQAMLLYLELTVEEFGSDKFFRLCRELYNKPASATKKDADSWVDQNSLFLNKAGAAFWAKVKVLRKLYEEHEGLADPIIDAIIGSPVNLSRFSVDQSRIQDTEELATLALNSFKEFMLGKTVHEVLEVADTVSHSYGVKNDTPKVTISTIHRAKGLEWEEVYISGVNDTIFPSHRAETDALEECRIFYVGMTRAKTSLVLSCVDKWPPSAFLDALVGSIDYYSLTKNPPNAQWKVIDDVTSTESPAQ